MNNYQKIDGKNVTCRQALAILTQEPEKVQAKKEKNISKQKPRRNVPMSGNKCKCCICNNWAEYQSSKGGHCDGGSIIGPFEYKSLILYCHFICLFAPGIYWQPLGSLRHEDVGNELKLAFEAPSKNTSLTGTAVDTIIKNIRGLGKSYNLCRQHSCSDCKHKGATIGCVLDSCKKIYHHDCAPSYLFRADLVRLLEVDANNASVEIVRSHCFLICPHHKNWENDNDWKFLKAYLQDSAPKPLNGSKFFNVDKFSEDMKRLISKIAKIEIFSYEDVSQAIEHIKESATDKKCRKEEKIHLDSVRNAFFIYRKCIFFWEAVFCTVY